MEVELACMGLWNGVVEGQFLFKERSISEAWRSGELDMWANCVLKHCLSLKTFIPNFVAFFVSLAVVISCVRKMSYSVTSAKREFTPADYCFIIHFPGGGQCPLVRDSEPIRLLEIPTSPSYYMPMQFISHLAAITYGELWCTIFAPWKSFCSDWSQLETRGRRASFALWIFVYWNL